MIIFKIASFVIITTLLINPFECISQRHVWDVTKMFEVNTEDAKPGTDNAIEAAREHFVQHPNDTVVLFFPEGVYAFFGDDHAINFGNEFVPGINGRLEFIGEGYDKTVFIAKNRVAHSINGRNVNRIMFKGIHFTRDYNTVTQGDVISVSRGEVIMRLHEGFPTPDSLIQYGITGGWGMYLRRYTDDPDDPRIIQENNDQIAWDNDGTYQIEGRIWRFALRNRNALAPYEEGHVIGVKLKHGGQTYWFLGGDDIVFEQCKWTQKSRGVFRGGISNIRFSGCVIERAPRVEGRVPCLSAPGGGPQIGQPNDPRITNAIVENCRIEATGDDNIAFFNVDGGIIRNNYLSDSFARGTLLFQVSQICLEDNTFIRCDPLWEGGDTESYCGPWDFSPPTPPENLHVVDLAHNYVTLTWNSSTDNIGVNHYNVFLANNKLASTADTTFMVTGLLPSTYYIFRIQAVDAVGNTSAFSSSLGVTTLDNSTGVNHGKASKHFPHANVFIDRAFDILHIDLHAETMGRKVRICDLKGSVVMKLSDFYKSTTVDLANFKPGLYLLVIEDPQIRKRIIIY